jgi:phage portal protein BeeE
VFKRLASRLFERKELSVANAWALIDFGRQTASSIAVTPENAWRCPIIRGAIAILSESIAQLPLLVYEVAADGSKIRATAHPLYTLLHDQPNDFTSSYEFRRDVQVDVLLHGHGFAHLVEAVPPARSWSSCESTRARSRSTRTTPASRSTS